MQEKGIRAVPQPGQRWGPHERTIHAVGVIRHPGAEYVAEELAKLKRRRIDTDYHLGYARARRHVTKAIQDAAVIIAWIDALP